MIMKNNKCPYCGNELKIGFLQSSGLAFFTPKLHRIFIAPNLTNEDEVVLTSKNMTYPQCEAFLCSDCKKVIIDYTNVKQEI